MSSVSWSIAALADEVAGVRQAAVDFAQAHGFPEERLGDLRLVVSEAVTNAVIHAFRDREHPGTITVSMKVTKGAVAEVVVRDDGIGFSRRTDSPGLGLGLGLIARLADQVEHRSPGDETGFELWMRFVLSAG